MLADCFDRHERCINLEIVQGQRLPLVHNDLIFEVYFNFRVNPRGAVSSDQIPAC